MNLIIPLILAVTLLHFDILSDNAHYSSHVTAMIDRLGSDKSSLIINKIKKSFHR